MPALIKKWDEQEINFLKENAGKITYEQMAKILNRSVHVVRGKGRCLNLQSQLRSRKYAFDQNFWNIPNPINCFYGGLMASDGYVGQKTANGYNLIIS